MTFIVEFWHFPGSDRCPACEFVSAIGDPKAQKKILRNLEMIETFRISQFWELYKAELIEKIDSELYAVRIEFNGIQYRLAFSLDGYRAVIYHGFVKKGKKIPLREIRTAKNRYKIHLETVRARVERTTEILSIFKERNGNET